LLKVFEQFGLVFSVFIFLDVLSAVFIGKIGAEWAKWYDNRFDKKADGAADSKIKSLSLSENFFIKLWLFNPVSITACLAQSSQVFYNFATIIFIFCYNKRSNMHSITSSISLSIIIVSQIYPVQYLVPFIIHKNRIKLILQTITFTFIILTINNYLNENAVQSVYKYILTTPDYTPNTGIFWYLVAEMFEHFRTLFLWILQLNIFIYAIPLSLRIQQIDTNLVLYLLISIQATFKSYSTLTDLLIPLILLPVFNKNTKFRKASFISYVAFFICVVLSPVMWNQWVVLGRGNSNFFFATSLGIVVCMALIISDILLGHFRLEFLVKNGKPEDSTLSLGKI
jgi:phosphatidylinositol glycan class U